MTPIDISILVNSTISVVELLLRYKANQPDLFAAEEQKLETLAHKVDALKQKPADYLQKWNGD